VILLSPWIPIPKCCFKHAVTDSLKHSRSSASTYKLYKLCAVERYPPSRLRIRKSCRYFYNSMEVLAVYLPSEKFMNDRLVNQGLS
jgi:hypothetical protein